MGIAIKLTSFLARIPRTAERLLPDMAAQEADNINVSSGELRPIRPLAEVFTPTAAPVLSMYRAEYNGAEKWQTWTQDVDVAKAPLSYDVEPRYYWTGHGCPRYAKYTDFGTTDYALGIPNPTQKPSASATGGVGSTINRTYCYTFYQPSTGEESGPSPIADVASGKVDGTWTIAGFSNTPVNDRAANYNTSSLKQRLYRTSGTASTFQLVAERAVATTDWTDILTDAQILGDELISADWEPPPVGLTGILCLPNGSMVGFAGNEICYSEPFQPHAWPIAYRQAVSFPIVGIAAFGTVVVVATTSVPYVADGADPSVVQCDRIDKPWPCLSKRSVTSVGDGVVFATRDGLVYVGTGGAQILTESFFTKEEWEPLNPASMVATMVNDRIYVAFTPTDGSTSLLAIKPRESAVISNVTLAASELYTDPNNGHLYVADGKVYQFDAGAGSRMTYNWLSKEIELPEPVNLGACLVDYVSAMSPADLAQAQANYNAIVADNAVILSDATKRGAYNQDAYNVIPMNGDHTQKATPPDEVLSFILYAEEKEIAAVDVTHGKEFRLPSDYKSSMYAIRLVGNVRVKSVKIGETFIDLKRV